MPLGKEFFLETFEKDEVSEAEKEIRGDDLEQVIDTPEKPEAPEADDKKVDKPSEETPPVKPEDKPDGKPVELDIDGEKVTIDQIKEWKKGNMRQADYTRKTQELAEQRKEIENIRKELEGTTSTPDKALAEKMKQLEVNLAEKELDLELAELKSKYPDFDEVKVLMEAKKRNIFDDLEFVYKAIRDETSSPVDIEKVKEQAILDYKEKLAKELEKDKKATEGSIISSEAGQIPVDYTSMLTSEEKEYCKKRGWTHKYYVEMRDAEYQL